MLSAVKSAFTTSSTPTPQTVDPLIFKMTDIPVSESRYKAIETWGEDDKGEYGLATLKSMLNRIGLDLFISNGKLVDQNGFAYISTKDMKPVATLRGRYQYGTIKEEKINGVTQATHGTYGHKIIINQNGDKEVYGPVYNDALNVVKVWASGKSGGKKRRSKTHKKKHTSRKTRRSTR